VLVCLYTSSIQAATSSIGNFAVVDRSSELSSGPATSVLPTNPYGGFWNAGSPGGTAGPLDWIVFDLLRLDFEVRVFSFSALGDGVHDPKRGTLQRGLTRNGPWFDVASFTGAAGISTPQYFNITATSARYFRWKILDKASTFQSCVARVDFLGSVITTAQPLNEFVIVDFNTQLITGSVNGYVTNLLPTSNPIANPGPAWNAAGITPLLPVWVVFDLQQARTLKVSGFTLADLGDGVHDVTSFTLQYSQYANGPWSSGASLYTFAAAASSPAIQRFALPSPVSAQYWLFTVTGVSSTFQAVISQVNFLVVS